MMIKKMIQVSLFLSLLLFKNVMLGQNLSTKKSTRVSAHFEDGDRIFLNLPMKNGEDLIAFADTGGGWNMIYPWILTEQKLSDLIRTTAFDEQEMGEGNFNYVWAKELFKKEVFYPFITESQKKTMGLPSFIVPSEQLLSAYGTNSNSTEGAFLGQYFFLRHSWVFDYPNQTVTLNPEIDLTLQNADTQKIGLKKDDSGTPVNGHPSIMAEIEGEEIPFLFDTGATFHLSPEARERLQRKEQIGGSFIAMSVFEKWKEQHPDWEIIRGGDVVPVRGQSFAMDMIRVPEVKLGTISVGPVWFSSRPDTAWSKGMIQSMDKSVQGALGGSALKYVSITIDYPNELIHFSN
ncbi:MAG: hypothetical protein AAGH81_14010 [Bacteroidota bacterium]